MPRSLGGNLDLWFTKIKRPASPGSCHPEDHSRPLPNSTTINTTSVLFKNFNCLYDHPTSDSTSSHVTSSESDAEAATPDFATVFASQRFFFSSPGSSNSIIESSSSLSFSSPTKPPESPTVAGGVIAIPTFSPDPYADFRRSMQEMVEARDLIDVRANWDYLHELLTCYLALNPKTTHKFIVGAFADLLVSLMPSPPEAVLHKSDFADGACKISRR